MVKHVDQTVITTNPITLIGGLLETRRALKSITNCIAGRSSLLPKYWVLSGSRRRNLMRSVTCSSFRGWTGCWSWL